MIDRFLYLVTKASQMDKAKQNKSFCEVFTDLGKGFALHEVVRDKDGEIRNYRILDCNELFEKILDIPAKDACDSLATDIFQTSRPPFVEMYSGVVESGNPEYFERYFPPLDMYFKVHVYRPEPEKFATVFQDITKEKQREKSEKHQYAVYELMREVNKVLWQEENPEKIANSICETIDRNPKAYPSAWIAIMDENNELEQFSSVNLKNADNFKYQLSNKVFPKHLKKTLESKTEIFVRVPKDNCNDCPLAKEHKDRLVFIKNIYFNKKHHGVLAVSLDEHYIDIDTEKRLFSELVDDIAFSIDAILSKNDLREVKNDIDITLNSIGDAVISTDIEGNVLRMNPIAENLCGWTSKQAKGKPLTKVFKIVNAFSREPVKNPAQTVLETGEIVGLANHTLLISKTGKEYQIADSAAPIRDADDNATGVVLVFRDVTEVYRKQQEIELSESMYRAVFENTGTATCTYGDDGIITRCNAQFEKLAALPASEIEGKLRWSDFVDKTDLQRMRGYHKDRSDGKHVRVDHEFVFVDADGHRKDVLVRVGMEKSSKVRVASLLDITESKCLAAELKESEEKFRKLAENSAAAIMMHQDDRWVYANRESEKISGYSRQELLSMKFWEFVHPDYVDKVMAAGRARESKEGANLRYEFVIITKSGKHKWIDISGTTITYQGKPAGLVNIIDITARKKAEEEIRNNLHELQRIADNLPSVIWKSEINEQGAFENTYIAENVDAMLALPEGTIGNDWEKFFSFIVSEYVPAARETFRQGLENPGKKISMEYRVNKGDGSTAWFVSTGKAYLQDGKTYVFGSTEDITEKVEARKKLRQTNTAIQAAIDGIAILDKNGRYTYLNQAHADIYGYDSPAQLKGNTWRMHYSGDELKRFTKEIMPVLRNTGRWRGEALGTKKDGSTFPQELSLTGLDEGGLICIVRDISERKAAEEALRKAKEKAEESDRLKSTFLANVSHEIRTPMNGILGFASLLEEADLTPEEAEHYLNVIQRSGKRMLEIINDLINISKIESGQTELHAVKTNLVELFKEQYDFFIKEAENTNIQLNLDISGIEIETAWLDRTKLSQVLTNLIKNALKFTEQGEIRITARTKGEKLYVSVADTGIGIPEEQKAVIFERFRQLSEDVDKPFEGAGLGLSISKAFVELMGGEMSLESVYGEGTEFSFYVVLNPDKSRKISESSSGHTTLSDKYKKVLVVDDDEGSNLLLTENLKRIGLENILSATNGRQAVELVRQHPDIMLVLMDVKMPEMDGHEATRIIKSENKDVVVVAQTAYASDQDKNIAMEAGCDDFISKPIGKSRLIEILKEHLG